MSFLFVLQASSAAIRVFSDDLPALLSDNDDDDHLPSTAIAVSASETQVALATAVAHRVEFSYTHKQVADQIKVHSVEQQRIASSTAIHVVNGRVLPTVMNPYFDQFAGCRNCNLELPPPVAAPDAHIMDLRHDVPPDFCQYLDLAVAYELSVGGKTQCFGPDDIRRDSGSDGSSDGSSFIDDEPVSLTDAEIAFVAVHVPGTAAILRHAAQQLAASACAAPVRKRCRVVSSSSESSSCVSTVADSIIRFSAHRTVVFDIHVAHLTVDEIAGLISSYP